MSNYLKYNVMKNFLIHSVAAISGFVCVVSCSEQTSDLEAFSQSTANELRIVTHTREGDDPSASVASVYLFNGSGAFVRTLQTDAAGSYTSASASVKLPEGSYTLCALGPGDLSSFQIPATPSPTSTITPVEGQAMGDLLMASATVSLSDGDAETVDMTLQRKVLELSTVTISQVPADVTGVTVSVAPFYSAIQFNGTYVEDNPLTVTIPLTAATTEGVWEATPRQLVFPSKGVPTITVTFTHAEGDPSSYTYTAETALTANNKYDIAGTYTEPLGVTLSGSLSLQPWADTNTDIPFDFDESNAVSDSGSGSGAGSDPSSGSGGSDAGSGTSDAPVVGQTYKGCYVVSVDETNRTAVLLSPTERSGFSVGNSNYNAAEWLNCLNTALLTWASVDGISGTWRIPTLEEIQSFAQPANIVEGIAQRGKKSFFCLDASNLKVAYFINKDGIAEFESTNTGFNDSRYLRPVIDVSY